MAVAARSLATGAASAQELTTLDAVRRWRNHAPHRQHQTEGRDAVFANYRIRVAEVLRDYSLDERGQAPADSNAAWS